jgi:hypothetical protein
MSWESISYWIEHHPGLASWVQAVGSIAAILVAIYIASGQSRRERKRIRERDLIMLKTVIDITGRAGAAVEVLSSDISAGGLGGESKCHVESYSSTMAALSLLELPDHRMIEPVVIARTYLEVAVGVVPAATALHESEARRNARWAISNSALHLKETYEKLSELRL